MTETHPTTQRDDALVDDDTPHPPGRPVRLVPTPAGFWRVAGGIALAMLAPLFGILIGSAMGADDPAARMDPLYWGFFIGSAVGAVGLVAAFLGARQLLRDSRAREAEQELHEPEGEPV